MRIKRRACGIEDSGNHRGPGKSARQYAYCGSGRRCGGDYHRCRNQCRIPGAFRKKGGSPRVSVHEAPVNRLFVSLNPAAVCKHGADARPAAADSGRFRRHSAADYRYPDCYPEPEVLRAGYSGACPLFSEHGFAGGHRLWCCPALQLRGSGQHAVRRSCIASLL